METALFEKVRRNVHLLRRLRLSILHSDEKIFYLPIIIYEMWVEHLKSALDRCDPIMLLYVRHATEVGEKIRNELPTLLEQGEISRDEFVSLTVKYNNLSNSIVKIIFDFEEKCTCKPR